MTRRGVRSAGSKNEERANLFFCTRSKLTGKTRWEDRVFSPILGDGGEVKYVIESIRDVTRVKILEKLYTDMRELIDKVVQSSVSGIIAANRRGEIILANKAAEELFGYSAEEVRNVHIESFYPKGVARDIMKMLRDEKHGGKGKAADYQAGYR